MTVALYARVSTGDQETDNQVQRLMAVANYRELEWRSYVDIASGADAHRPQLDKLMNDAQNGKVNHIIATKLDRLARSTINLLHIMQQLDSWRVTVEFLDQPLDTSTPSGKLMLTILGAMAEFERELIRDRTRDGLERARKEGRVGGRPKHELSDYQRRKAVRIIAENPQISLTELASHFNGISRSTLVNLLREEGIL